MGNRNSVSSRCTLDPAATRLHTRGTNRILSLLPTGDSERIVARCEKQSLLIEKILYAPRGLISHVYFPLSGMVSLVLSGEEGGTIEVGVVGNEGLAGTAAALGSDTSHVQALIQVQGDFLRMTVHDFRLELRQSEVLTGLVHRYSQALMIQVSQSVMCNRLHSMEQRICRWLLMAHDRAGTDEINLTQEFIAQMLGIRRATVTVAAGMLQKAGFINYSRGRVTVLDRKGLEDASCPCYGIVAREVETLMRRSCG